MTDREGFVFQLYPFVTGSEEDPDEWNEDERRIIPKLRAWYPELATWKDLALVWAWGGYSQDVYEVNWTDWQTERDPGFLAYVYIRNRCPGFDFRNGVFGMEVLKYAQTSPWLTTAPLPDWVTS